MQNSKTKDELVSICKEQYMKRYTGKKTDYTIRNISKYVKDEMIQDIKKHKSNL